MGHLRIDHFFTAIPQSRITIDIHITKFTSNKNTQKKNCVKKQCTQQIILSYTKHRSKSYHKPTPNISQLFQYLPSNTNPTAKLYTQKPITQPHIYRSWIQTGFLPCVAYINPQDRSTRHPGPICDRPNTKHTIFNAAIQPFHKPQ